MFIVTEYAALISKKRNWYEGLVCRQIISCLYFNIRDLFNVYLNRFEFHFLWLHINKTNKFCLFMHNGRVPGIVK